MAISEQAEVAAHEHSYVANKTKGDYLTRLRRIEGQARWKRPTCQSKSIDITG